MLLVRSLSHFCTFPFSFANLCLNNFFLNFHCIFCECSFDIYDKKPDEKYCECASNDSRLYTGVLFNMTNIFTLFYRQRRYVQPYKIEKLPFSPLSNMQLWHLNGRMFALMTKIIFLLCFFLCF